MPIYEYQCDACTKRIEVIQSFSAAPETVCAACGGAMRKLISSPAIQFKGSGFYITDYGKAGSGGGGGKSSSEGGSAASSGSDSTSGSSDSSSSASAGTASTAGSSTSTPSTSSPAGTKSSSSE